MSLIQYVLSHVDYEAYYKSKFPEWDENHNTNVICPFHEDTNPSFSININGKGGCVCHACGTKIASIVHYEKATNEKQLSNDELAASRIYSEFIRPVLAAPEEATEFLFPVETALKSSPKIFKEILNELSINEKTLDSFSLGWCPSKRRVAIPIFDEFGQLLNIRWWRLPSMRSDETYPKIINENGFGSPSELFPKSKIGAICRSKHKPETVFWMSGERDTLLAWHEAIPSFCYTTGEQTLRKEWGAEIKALESKIGIVRDNDSTGEEGAAKRKEFLENLGISCFIVELQGEKVKDFSDWMRVGNTAKDFLKLGDSKNGSEPHPPPHDDRGSDEFLPIPRIHDPSQTPSAGEFSVDQIGRNPLLLNKPITCKGIVSGKMARTHAIPSIIQLGTHQYKIPISREMLQLAGENDIAIHKILHSWLNTKSYVKIVECITVTEVEIIPMLQIGINTPYVNQKCFFFGENIECNKPYYMNIIPTTSMKTQEVLGMITRVEPVSNILDNYSFSPESCELLRANFHVADEEDRLKKLRELAHVIATRYSHIYHRDDVHLCIMLSWLCPLEFEFPREGVQRGWLNTLIVGDTETGKSKVAQALTRLFDCGVFVSSESCSYVGLVGGMVKSSSSGAPILRWGKIPLYNRQLVVLEELSGLTTEDISHMSEIRSAGIARYDKAGLTGETAAKTRLVCLSNVRGNSKKLEDYPSGVEAARELVGQQEDLARFDLLLTTTDDEVDGSIINQDRSHGMEETFSDDELKCFKELVMFAWSLKANQINFTLSAYRACLQQTLELTKVYHPSLPIFKSGSGRLKLARIALAIACVQFSWHDNKLEVRDKHVETAARLLDSIYKKPSLGYAKYSKIQFNLQMVVFEDETLKKINEAFKGKMKDFLLYVAHSMSFTKFDIAEAMGVHNMYVERVISQMYLSNLLKKGLKQAEWTLSRAGRKWVDKKITEFEK